MLDSGDVSEGMAEASSQKNEDRPFRQIRLSAFEIDLR